MDSMQAFFTRERANEGITIPLYLPDGSRSQHHLLIRGVDSDAFRDVEAESKRNAMRLLTIEDPEERKIAIRDEKLTILASLVIDWSFEEDCTPQNIKHFLREAPQIADAIDQLAAKRSLFLGEKSSNSRPLQNPSSDSVCAPAAPA